MILKNIIKARQAIIIVNIWAIFKKPRSVFVLETFKNSIKNLDNDIKINITAVFTIEQLKKIKKVINNKTPVIISIFCGRIADNGIDPEPIIRKAKKIFQGYKNVKILWASVRETFNFAQAKRTGADIITVPPKFIDKYYSKKLSLPEYSRTTVKQFFLDGKKSKYKL